MAEKRKYENPNAESLDVADVDVAQKSDRVVVIAKRRLQPKQMLLDLYDRLLESHLQLVDDASSESQYYHNSKNERVSRVRAVASAVYEEFTRATTDNRTDFLLVLRGQPVEMLTETYQAYLGRIESYLRSTTIEPMSTYRMHIAFFIYTTLPEKFRNARFTEKLPLSGRLYAAGDMLQVRNDHNLKGIEKFIKTINYRACKLFQPQSKWTLADIAPFYSWVNGLEAKADRIYEMLYFHPNIKKLTIESIDDKTPRLILPLRHENLLEITFDSRNSPVVHRLFIASVLIRTPNVTHVEFDIYHANPPSLNVDVDDALDLPLACCDNLKTLCLKHTWCVTHDYVYPDAEDNLPFFIRVPSLTRLTIPYCSSPSIHKTAPEWWTENMPSLSVLHLTNYDAPAASVFDQNLKSHAPRGVLLRFSYTLPDPAEDKEKLRDSISAKETEWNQNVVNQRVKWTKACILIASYRANHDSVICNSVLPIIEHVAALIGTDIEDHIAFLT